MTGMDILKNQNLLYCLFKISVLSTMLWFAKISSKHDNSMFWVNLACVHLPLHSFFSKSNHQKCLFHPFFTNEVEYAAMPAHHVVTAAGHTSAINVVPGRYWHHKYFSSPLPLMHFRDCCRLPPLHRQASCRCTLMSSSDGKWWLPVTRSSDLYCSGLAMNHTLCRGHVWHCRVSTAGRCLYFPLSPHFQSQCSDFIVTKYNESAVNVA